ncbi:uncharacterized protein LOC141601376 [Silene latifolia]|uniref:uncharacterized protein LOC141601376 n=1 Tax=Silene latifolia TaxID=37657 RepID=UPI003D770980
MNRVRKQKEINFFLQNKDIGLFGLPETKIKNKAVHKALGSFNSRCISTNNGYHSGGRIWILWQPQAYRIQFLEYNAQFIHMKVESLLNRNVLYLTMVYAFNGVQGREPIWAHLRRISHLVNSLWAIAGDFNCVLSAAERIGGNTLSSEMDSFRACVDDCGVIDITSVGSIFTWNNKQKPEQVQNLQEDIGKDPSNLQLIEEEFREVEELKELTEARDNFLAQKSKQVWIQDGDSNSAFFHGMLKRRRVGNKVIMVEDMNGKLCDSPAKIQSAFLEYYHQLLGTSQETGKLHKRIIDQGPKCNEEMVGSLLVPVTAKEIRDVMFSILDIKSPGPDGYTSRFFKDAWNEIGGEVVAAVKDFFLNKKLLR